MKNRFRIALGSLLAFVSISLFSCNTLHIHEYEWKHDEDHHWQECTHCGERIGVTEHKMSTLNDTCIVCGYKDPVVIKNEEGVVTGLTKYAKTKANIEVPSDIKYVGKESLSGAKATSITIHKSLIGICKGAFAGTSLKEDGSDIIYADESKDNVDWVEYNDVYYKLSKTDEYDAAINGVYYTTFKDAVAAVKEDNVTITLLKNIDCASYGDIEINYDINLEWLRSETCKLEGCHFVIRPSGSVRIANNITYTGQTDLLLGEVKEPLGSSNGEQPVFTSGSLIFLGQTTKPDGVDVRYVDDIENGEPKPAVGAPQREKILTTDDNDCFAYGLFKMNKSFDKIVGLTDFGAAVSGLTVVNPIEGRNFEIADWAFTTPTQIRIKIPIKDIKINLNKQKGAYRNLTISDGITKIGKCSCSNWYDGSQVPGSIVADLAAILAPLTKLKINSSVTEINYQAFYYCAGLTTVIVEGKGDTAPSLTTIASRAFESCLSLKNVNLAECVHLKQIQKNAFCGCNKLETLTLPSNVGWLVDRYHGFTPEELKKSAAYLFSKAYHSYDWERNIDAKFCYYHPIFKDKEGRYNFVWYANDFQTAYNNSLDYYTISSCTTEPYEIKDFTFNKILRLSSSIAETGFKISGSNNKIATDKRLILDKGAVIEQGSTITLNSDGSGSEYKNVASLAVETAHNSKKNAGYTVLLKNGSSSGGLIYSVKAKLKDAKDFDVYGLFNVKYDAGNYKCYINSLSKLGGIATEFEVGILFSEHETIIGDNAFKGNKKIRKITFGEGVRKIGRHVLSDNVMNSIEHAVFKGMWDFEYRSFVACKKLSIVDFSEDKQLRSLGEKSFSECPNLKEVVLPTDCELKKIGKNAFEKTPLTKFDFANIKSKWKAGNHNFGDEELTPEVAAKYLTNDYKSSEWTRAA